MSRALRKLPWDLRDAALFAVLAAGLAALPLPGWLRVALLLPLVLLLPGYALAAAVFPRPLPGEERFVYSVAFSLCSAILGGLLAQLALPLTTAAWAVLLAGITVAASLFAAIRRQRAGVGAPEHPRLRAVGLPAVAVFLIALGIVAWSVSLATTGVREQEAEARFTSLWIVPRADGAEGTLVGVENHEGRDVSYRLVVTARSDSEARKISVDLDDGATRAIDLGPWTSPVSKATVAKLYRAGRLYRQVRLSPEAPA